MTIRQTLFAALLPASLVLASCGSDESVDGEDCAEGKCDVVTSKAVCDVFDMRSAAGLQDGKVTAAAFKKLQDPVAKLLLRTGSCPTSFEEIQAKITKALPDCKDNIETHIISETINATNGKDTNFRAVVSRGDCKKHKEPELVISMFGMDKSTTAAEIKDHEVEIIGFDATAGVFNYYALEDLSNAGSGKAGKTWRFFGSSQDFVADKVGEGDFPFQVRRCGACHVDGGLIQKELESPWLHWDQGGKISEVAGDYVAKAPELLGSTSSGASVEGSIIEPGNTTYAPKAVAFLKTRPPADLLRPLFCTNEMNIESNGSGFIQTLLIDEMLTGGQFGELALGNANFSVGIDDDVMAKAARDVNQRVLNNDKKIADDVLQRFAYPERSFMDMALISQLVQKKILDKQLAQAVLMIDFTNPVFSSVRCDLLARLAPKIAKATKTAAGLRKAIDDALGTSPAAGSAEKLLKDNLAKTPAQFETEINDRKAKCDARTTTAAKKAAFAKDLQAIVSLRRNQARGLPVLEFQATLPIDDLQVDADAHLDENCELACVAPPCFK